MKTKMPEMWVGDCHIPAHSTTDIKFYQNLVKTYGLESDITVSVIINDLIPLIEVMAGKKKGRLGCDYDDAIGIAMEDCMAQIKHYDPFYVKKGDGKEALPVSFFCKTIDGAINKVGNGMLRGLSKYNIDIAVKALKVRNKLELMGIEPTTKKIAHVMGIREEVLIANLKEYEGKNGEIPIGEEMETYFARDFTLSPEENSLRNEVMDTLLEAMEELNERERYVFKQTSEGVPQKKIGLDLKVSQGTVSRIYGRARRKLRENKLLRAYFDIMDKEYDDEEVIRIDCVNVFS